MTTDEMIQRLKCYPTGLMKTEVYEIIAKLRAAEDLKAFMVKHHGKFPTVQDDEHAAVLVIQYDEAGEGAE